MSKEKSVLIVNHNAGSPWHGPNLRSYYVAKHLVKKGYSVYVISSSYSHKYINLPDISGKITKEVIDGIHYYWVRTSKYDSILGRLKSFWQFGRLLPEVVGRHIPQIQAVVCSSPPPVFIKICHRIARAKSARLIFEVRDLWPLTILEMGAATKYNPYVAYMDRLERFAYENSDAVVSVLPCAESYMIEHGLAQGKFFSIENGTEIVDEIEINQQDLPSEIYEALSSKSKFRVGYAGAFDRDNDLATLLRAAKRLANENIEFVLVGKGKEYKSLIEDAKFLPNIKILPPVRSDQVPWVLQRFDVCYMGLKKKNIFKYGISMNKIFEYMRSAKPIISAIEAGNDIVSAASCGTTVTPEDAESVASVIKAFSGKDPSHLKQLGKNGFDYLKEKHVYEVLVNDWIKVISG